MPKNNMPIRVSKNKANAINSTRNGVTPVEKGVSENQDHSMYVAHDNPESLLVNEYRLVKMPHSMVARNVWLLKYIKDNFPKPFYKSVEKETRKLSLWVKKFRSHGEFKFVNSWFSESPAGGANEVMSLSGIRCTDSYAPLLYSPCETILRINKDKLFATLRNGDYTIPRFNSDGTFSFAYVFRVETRYRAIRENENNKGKVPPPLDYWYNSDDENLEQQAEKEAEVDAACYIMTNTPYSAVSFQLAQASKQGVAPYMEKDKIRQLLENKNTNPKICWRAAAKKLLFEQINFHIIAGVHRHGGTKHSGAWITIRPTVGDCWHLELGPAQATNSDQAPITINGVKFVLTGGTYGKEGNNITTKYITDLCTGKS